MLTLNRGEFRIISEYPTDSDIQEFMPAIKSKCLNLYKYYEENEERDITVPDVLDAIDSNIDLLDKEISAQSYSYHYNPQQLFRMDRLALRRRREDFELLRAKIMEQDYTWYMSIAAIVAISKAEPKIVPVKLGELTLYKPRFNKETLKFEPVKSSIEVLVLEDSDYLILPRELTFIQDWHNYYLDFNMEDYDMFAYTEQSLIENCNPKGSTIKKCSDCGEYFWISADEAQWFKSKNLSVPKRCNSCRAKRKQSRGNL